MKKISVMILVLLSLKGFAMQEKTRFLSYPDDETFLRVQIKDNSGPEFELVIKQIWGKDEIVMMYLKDGAVIQEDKTIKVDDKLSITNNSKLPKTGHDSHFPEYKLVFKNEVDHGVIEKGKEYIFFQPGLFFESSKGNEIMQHLEKISQSK